MIFFLKYSNIFYVDKYPTITQGHNNTKFVLAKQHLVMEAFEWVFKLTC